ncbi:hypothetical protein [Hydrogenophaga sp. T2]|uniref:hypothetical protein n=1 Tax=Hydrogenophaga sp. T2 TaxID=3132823 RepID=UPI003CEA32E0
MTARTPAPLPTALPPGEPPPSPAARAHRLQRQRLDTLRAQLAELDALEQTARQDHTAWVAPLQARQVQLQKALVQALDAALDADALHRPLSPAQRATARERLCALAQALVEDGHADMAALHDRHSPQTLAQKRQARAEALRAQFEAALGAPIEGLDGASPEAVLRAGWQRLQAADEARRQARQDKREKRDQRQQRKKTAAAAGAPGLPPPDPAADADRLLRQVFRQLASALHPDRESDPARRAHKTALMAEANTAYARRDLMALMDLQQRAALADSGPAAAPSDERLAALTLLLKQQVAALERERAARQAALGQLFELPAGVSANANTLRQARLDAVQRLDGAIAALEHALGQTADAARLKRWLNGPG